MCIRWHQQQQQIIPGWWGCAQSCQAKLIQLSYNMPCKLATGHQCGFQVGSDVAGKGDRSGHSALMERLQIELLHLINLWGDIDTKHGNQIFIFNSCCLLVVWLVGWCPLSILIKIKQKVIHFCITVFQEPHIFFFVNNFVPFCCSLSTKGWGGRGYVSHNGVMSALRSTEKPKPKCPLTHTHAPTADRKTRQARVFDSTLSVWSKCCFVFFTEKSHCTL